jgi:protein tyrosine phosphatase
MRSTQKKISRKRHNKLKNSKRSMKKGGSGIESYRELWPRYFGDDDVPCELENGMIKNDCKELSRYGNIFSSKSSMEKITGLNDTFFNGSLMSLGNNKYIATQCPIPKTFETFWDVVWENDVKTIVMVTNWVEKEQTKCDNYYDKYSPGKYTIEVGEPQPLDGYTLTQLSVTDTKSGKERTVSHYYFEGWADHGAPESGDPLINLVNIVREVNPNTKINPILVHCSAGVGRTGTFIALHHLVSNYGGNIPNNINTENEVINLIKKMRRHRTFMVQSYKQYEFIINTFNKFKSQLPRPASRSESKEQKKIVVSNNTSVCIGTLQVLKELAESKGDGKYFNKLFDFNYLREQLGLYPDDKISHDLSLYEKYKSIQSMFPYKRRRILKKIRELIEETHHQVAVDMSDVLEGRRDSMAESTRGNVQAGGSIETRKNKKNKRTNKKNHKRTNKRTHKKSNKKKTHKK